MARVEGILKKTGEGVTVIESKYEDERSNAGRRMHRIRLNHQEAWLPSSAIRITIVNGARLTKSGAGSVNKRLPSRSDSSPGMRKEHANG
jgi:hypothetical protein